MTKKLLACVALLASCMLLGICAERTVFPQPESMTVVDNSTLFNLDGNTFQFKATKATTYVGYTLCCCEK